MIEVIVPRESVNDTNVIIRVLNFQDGDLVHQGDAVVEIETSKTNIEIESPSTGYIKHSLKIGDEITVGSILFVIRESEQEAKNDSLETSNLTTLSPQNAGTNSDLQLFSQAAERLIKDLHINKSDLGPGWYTTEDFRSSPSTSRKSFPAISDGHDQIGSIPIPYEISTSSIRKRAEMTSLVRGNASGLTSTIGVRIELKGDRFSPPPFLFMDGISDLVIYEGSKLLKKYSDLNGAYIDEKSVALFKHVNFGISFDSGNNLKVLSIIDADKLTLHEIHTEVNRLLDLYESGKQIPVELLTSSTVTISDLSKTSASYMRPLLNGYQGLILGVVKSKKNLFEIYATFDHRISSGLTVARYLEDLKNRIMSYYPLSVERACAFCKKSIVEEIARGNRGFIRIEVEDGEEVSVCRNCFDRTSS